jgi:hypothetical protein
VRPFLALFVCVIVSFNPCVRAGELTPPEARGREIFMQGWSASGEITATIDGGATRLPGTTFPCAGCHGRDGRGRSEGGIVPSNVTPDALSRPYESATATGRRHGPYNDRKLKRAITLGFDPAGNVLDAAMPRYAMAQSDFDALKSFMARLGDEHDPGLSESSIRLGVILPPRATMQQASDETRAILEAWIGDVNRRGGVHGRNLELAFTDPAGDPAARADAVAKFIDDSKAFALISSFTEGAEREIAEVAESKQIPLVTSLASNPRSSVAPSMYVREVFAGLNEQIHALVQVASRGGTEGKRAAVASRDPRLASVRDAAVETLRSAGFAEAKAFDDARSLRGHDAVVFLDEGLLREFHANGGAGTTLTLVPASLANPDLFGNTGARALLSFATLPRDWSETALALRARLSSERQIGRTHPAAQFAALASASLALDALARAGRSLGRDAFLDAIDKTRRFQGGFAPPITFRPDRHLGSTGAYVIDFEAGKPGEPEWIDPES